MDTIRVTFLPDGRVKVETDAVSAPNHLSAEQAISLLSRLCGGDVELEKARQHHHEHGQQEHAHQEG